MNKKTRKYLKRILSATNAGHDQLHAAIEATQEHDDWVVQAIKNLQAQVRDLTPGPIEPLR